MLHASHLTKDFKESLITTNIEQPDKKSHKQCIVIIILAAVDSIGLINSKFYDMKY